MSFRNTLRIVLASMILVIGSISLFGCSKAISNKPAKQATKTTSRQKVPRKAAKMPAPKDNGYLISGYSDNAAFSNHTVIELDASYQVTAKYDDIGLTYLTVNNNGDFIYCDAAGEKSGFEEKSDLRTLFSSSIERRIRFSSTNQGGDFTDRTQLTPKTDLNEFDPTIYQTFGRAGLSENGNVVMPMIIDTESVLFKMKVDGTGKKRIKLDSSIAGSTFIPAPDFSKILAFDSDNNVGEQVKLIDNDGQVLPSPAMQAYAGSVSQAVADGIEDAPPEYYEYPYIYNIVWLPNSAGFLYTANDENQENVNLYLWNTSNNSASVIGQFPGNEMVENLSISRDGKTVAFDNGSNIYTMSIGDGTLTNVTPEHGGNGSPAWSPNGKKLVFLNSTLIWIMNRDGSDKKKLSANMDGVDGPIKWIAN